MRCRKISHKTRHISSSESDSSGSSDDDDTSPYSKFPKSPNDDSVSSLDPQEGSDDGSDDDSVYSLEPLQGSDDGDTEQVSKDIQTLFSPRGELERSFSFSDDECTSESPLQTEKDAHCIETKEQQVMDAHCIETKEQQVMDAHCIEIKEQQLMDACEEDLYVLFLYAVFLKANPKEMRDDCECPLNRKLMEKNIKEGVPHTRLHFCDSEHVTKSKKGNVYIAAKKQDFTCGLIDCEDDERYVRHECDSTFTSLRSLQRHNVLHHNALGNPFHWSKVKYGQMMNLFNNPYPCICDECFRNTPCFDPLCCNPIARREMLNTEWHGMEVRPFHVEGKMGCIFAMKPNEQMFTDIGKLRAHFRKKHHGIGDQHTATYRLKGTTWGDGTTREFDKEKRDERLQRFTLKAQQSYLSKLDNIRIDPNGTEVTLFEYEQILNRKSYKPLVNYRKMTPQQQLQAYHRKKRKATGWKRRPGKKKLKLTTPKPLTTSV